MNLLAVYPLVDPKIANVIILYSCKVLKQLIAVSIIRVSLLK